MLYKIEIATTDFPTTESAVQGGADRIELCTAISEGGLTPSFGLIKKCIQKFDLPVFPIIRPRSGDFLYAEDEFLLMLDDISQCRQLGCQGIVTGFLLADGAIDFHRTQAAVLEAKGMEVTFHRAFDRCKNPEQALELIIKAGCKRILTSGQQLKAIEGSTLIKKLVEIAGDRIVIMPGSGVTPENIQQLQRATGATEFHAALRSTSKSTMKYKSVVFENDGDYTHAAIDKRQVAALKLALAGGGLLT